MTGEERFTEAEAHSQFAKSTNGRVWELLAKQDRSTSEDEELLLNAYASLFHWTKVGTAIHAQRGHWLISHSLVALNLNHQAVHHALRCAEITNSNLDEMKDFDLAYAQEGMARAYAALGDIELAKDHYQQAKELGAKIKDDEDQEIFMSDLMKGDWEAIN